MTIDGEGRVATWRLDDDADEGCFEKAWAYHGSSRPRSVDGTWPGGPVCSCDALGRLRLVDPATGGPRRPNAVSDTRDDADGGWRYVNLGPANRKGEPEAWCLVSHRHRTLVAYDPTDDACLDLGDLPGHCRTITSVIPDALRCWGPDSARQLRVAAACTGGVAFVWAPTAEDPGREEEAARGGVVELSLPPGPHDPARERRPDYSAPAAERAVQAVINAIKDRRQGVHRAQVKRFASRASQQQIKVHVDILGLATSTTPDHEHLVVCWSARRVGVWRDDRSEKYFYPERNLGPLALKRDDARSPTLQTSSLEWISSLERVWS